MSKTTSNKAQFEGEGVVFKAKLIGLELVPEPRGDKMCQNSIIKLKAIIKGTNSHKRRITLKISYEGIKVYDEKTNEILHHHKVPEISYIAKDDQDGRTFGYVFGVPSKAHQFICFKTAGPAAAIMSVISELFDCVLQRKNQEKQDQQQSTSIVSGRTFTGGSTNSDRSSNNSSSHKNNNSGDNLSSLLFDTTPPSEPVQSLAQQSFWPTTGSPPVAGKSSAAVQSKSRPTIFDNVFETDEFDTFPVFTASPHSQHKSIGGGTSGGHSSGGTSGLLSANRAGIVPPLLPSPPSKHRSTNLSSSAGVAGTAPQFPTSWMTSGNAALSNTMKSAQLPRQQSWSGEVDRYAAFQEIDVLSSVFESALASSGPTNSNSNSTLNSANSTGNFNNYNKNNNNNNNNNNLGGTNKMMSNNNNFNFNTKAHAELTRSSSSGGSTNHHDRSNNIFARTNPFADGFFS